MRSSSLRDIARQIWNNPLSIAGLTITVALLIVALLAPHLAPYDHLKTDPVNKLKPPSQEHPFGTDGLGRDILSRVLMGARITVRIALLILVLSGSVGTLIGILAGYSGGTVDNLLMRVTDVFIAFPRLILAMAISAALGPSLQNVVIALSIAQWTYFARLARSKALVAAEEDYVEAAQATGASSTRILLVHVLPMSLSPVIIQGTIIMGSIIITAAGLGFIGFGAQPPTPEWGVMVSNGREFMPRAWWVSTFPGIAIMLTVLGFNMLGDGIRDILDPRFS
ncbi:MAG: ABC transporter permease [Candidatus Acetothermia bacterium]